jgi:hypothetical protein
MGYSHRESTQGGELDERSKPNRTRAKGSLPENTLLQMRKDYSLFLGMLKKGVADVGDDNDA